MSWYEESVIYQIYPLGFCGAPRENDGITSPRISKVIDWIPYFQELGVDTILFNPIFESDRHGYDTRDYQKIDGRLGTNKVFAEVCEALHSQKMRVILDGVFNHVGRGFWAFQDVLEKKEQSSYKDWFYLRFHENNKYNDGFFYEGWEGHYELVKLNLKNPQVEEYLLSCVKSWITEYGIDGLRLDVAYCLDREFMRTLKRHVQEWKKEFVLIGEVLFGDYNLLVNDLLLDSCTNYEAYKGLYSSFNDKNMFEISYSLNRQFGPEQYTLYKGKHLLAFLDNHDVSRIASMLKEKKQLKTLYGLLFAMPGVPCIYYGSEWGEKGEKSAGDHGLRPCFTAPVKNELFEWIKELILLYREERALSYGTYENITVRSQQFIFKRTWEKETVVVALNGEEAEATLSLGNVRGKAVNLFTQEEVLLEGEIKLDGFEFAMWRLQ